MAEPQPFPDTKVGALPDFGGMNDDDIRNWAGGTDQRTTAPEPTSAAPEPEPEPSPEPKDGATFPPPPAPTPGVYSPAKEQAAMRAASAIQDPARRARVMQYLKQDYANDRMMDGVTAQMREDNKNTATASYFGLVNKLMDSQDIGWNDKLTGMNTIVSRIRNDPRLAYGETQQLVIDHLYNMVGLPNPRTYGADFLQVQSGVADGTISSVEQILQMEKPTPDGRPPRLTYKGGQEAITMLNERNKPEGNLNKERAEFFKRYGGAIDPGVPGAGTALGQQKIYMAMQAAKAREVEVVAKKGNPLDVYTPGTKDYFGTPENMAKYHVSMAETMRYEAERMTAEGTPASAEASPVVPALPAPAAGAAAAAPAPDGTPLHPWPTTGMTREQIIAKYKPGDSVILPDGRKGTVPSPSVSQ
jgi:hypothetical protein